MTIVESLKFTLETSDLLRACASARHFDCHMHDTFSVVAVTKGSASLQSRRWSKSVQAGDVFVFNPFEAHMGGDANHPIEYQILYPSWPFVLDCCSLPDRKSALPMIRTDVVRKCNATEALIDALSVSAGGGGAIETELCKFLRRCSFELDGIAQDGMSAIRAACRLIHESYESHICTEMLAARVGLHKSHFVRVFHRVTGFAPQTYLRQVRIARARELICAGVALSETAHLVGFCDQPHLTREFRKVYGVTPGRLMRDLRSGRQKHLPWGASK